MGWLEEKEDIQANHLTSPLTQMDTFISLLIMEAMPEKVDVLEICSIKMMMLKDGPLLIYVLRLTKLR